MGFREEVLYLGFPGGSDGKESACNTGDPGSIPGSGRSPGEGNGNPLQYSCLENSKTEEPGRLGSMGSQRIGHNRATNTIYPFKVLNTLVIKHLEENRENIYFGLGKSFLGMETKRKIVKSDFTKKQKQQQQQKTNKPKIYSLKVPTKSIET